MSRKVVPLNDLLLQTPLLQAKLLVPQAVPGLVARPRIHARLDEGLRGRLTLVTAPAGYGKTCAVAQWARERELLLAWLSLDAGDNDPVRFWTYVAAALKGLQPGIGVQMAPMLRSSTSPPLEAAISLLIDDMSRLPFVLALVLDDYHVISEPLVHETLSFLVRYAPEQLHPVIVSRAEPPVTLVARQKTVGQVTELTAGDLGFAADEVSAFYARRNIELTGKEVARLAERTGGWAAGMQMAAMSLSETDDKAATIERFGGRDPFLAGYFMAEVFGTFGSQVQEFLLQTSILGHLSGPLCAVVTGRPDSGAVLAAVGKTCGFLARLDEEWYVYHHLFAEFLQGLLKERCPEQIRGLYGRAARWYVDAELAEKAVDCFLQGEEYGQAACLVERLVPEMLDRGETATLFRWLEVLPPETVGESPALCVAQAWADAAANRTAGVEHWLERADVSGGNAEITAPGGGRNDMAVDMAVLRAYLAIKRRDVPGTLRWLAQAGQTPERVFTYGRGVVLPLGTSLLGGPAGWFGHLKDKARAMESGVYLKVRSLAQPAARGGYLLVANAEALYEWNQIDDAAKSLLEGMEEAQRAEEAGALVPALFTLAKIHRSRGDLAAALNVATQAEKTVRSLGWPQWLFPLAALKARLSLAAGDPEAVDAWLTRNRLDIYDRLSTARAYEHVTLARVLLAQGRAEGALLLLQRLLVFAEKEKWLPQTIEVSNLLVIAHDAVGKTAQALEILRGNLARGRENGYLRSFVDEGAPMTALLRRLARKKRNLTGEENAYMRSLVALCGRSPVSGHAGTPAPSSPPEPLTRKELAVLKLVAAGLDRRSIATELGVTLPTVKTHLAGIYGKLGVPGRREAVEQARRLGILL